MVKGGLGSSLIEHLEKLEVTLYGAKLEELFATGRVERPVLFNDILEKVIFLIALELALEGKVGVTAAMLAERTHKTKNTVNMRLERLYYKRLLQRQQIGNAILYYIPLPELLLSAVAKELIQVKRELDETLETVPEENLEKELLAKYLKNARIIIRRNEDQSTRLEGEGRAGILNLKEKIIG
ncbi:MAG: hypothetical protein ACFFBD_04835 [Candidatus Hodarchaeota archaeon]